MEEGRGHHYGQKDVQTVDSYDHSASMYAKSLTDIAITNGRKRLPIGSSR